MSPKFYSERIHSLFRKLIVALFLIDNVWKQDMFLKIDDWIKNL